MIMPTNHVIIGYRTCLVGIIKLKHDNANQACSVTYDDMISAVHVYGQLNTLIRRVGSGGNLVIMQAPLTLGQLESGIWG